MSDFVSLTAYIHPVAKSRSAAACLFPFCVRLLRRAFSQSSTYWYQAPLKSTNATGVYEATQHLHLIWHKKGRKGRRGDIGEGGMEVGKHRPRPIDPLENSSPSFARLRIDSICLLHDTIYLIQKNWHNIDGIDTSLWSTCHRSAWNCGREPWLHSLTTVVVV